MKPHSFLVPLPHATGMLMQMETEIEGLSPKSKLKLTLIDDGCAQKLFLSLCNWIEEHKLSGKIHLHRVKGDTCTLKVQFPEAEGKRLKEGLCLKAGIYYLHLILGILLRFV